MPPVRKQASVSASTVTRLSRGELAGAIPSTNRRGQRIFAVRDGWAVRIDPRIMAVLHANDTDFRCVEVISTTEVIVHNNRIR